MGERKTEKHSLDKEFFIHWFYIPVLCYIALEIHWFFSLHLSLRFDRFDWRTKQKTIEIILVMFSERMKEAKDVFSSVPITRNVKTNFPPPSFLFFILSEEDVMENFPEKIPKEDNLVIFLAVMKNISFFSLSLTPDPIRFVAK